MQEVDDKKLSDLSKKFLQAISYCGLSGYKLKKDNIISSESTLKTCFNVSCWFIKCYTSEVCVKRKLSEKKVMSFY